MNVELVRKIDYWAGIPLCFLGTLMKKLGRVFGGGARPERPHNVLLIELSEMGSVILADPAMLKLKRELGANLHFAIFRKNAASLDFLGTVPPENVFIMGDDGLKDVALGTLRFFFWARARQIDTVIDLELFSRFTALMTWLSGARFTAGFYAFHNEGLYRGDFLSHRVAYNPHLHIAKNFVALVNALLAGSAELPYSKTLVQDEEIALRTVTVSAAAQDAMRERIRERCPAYLPGRHRVILFNTNASDLVPLRRWPQENYVRLARTVLERHPDVVLLLTGSPAERPGKVAIVDAVASERCVNFAGETTVAELVQLYAVSSFMLTNDSGPAHFASVTAMPVVVLFGPETPAIYGPLGNMTPIYAGLACSPCVSATNHRKSACNDNICLQVITPEQVYQVLAPHLTEPERHEP